MLENAFRNTGANIGVQRSLSQWFSRRAKLQGDFRSASAESRLLIANK